MGGYVVLRHIARNLLQQLRTANRSNLRWTNIADAVRAYAASVPRALAFIGVPMTLT